MRIREDRRAVSNVIVFVLGLVIIVVVVSNVFLWNYEMNQLDWEKMQEGIEIVNVSHLTETGSYNPSGYILDGTTFESGDLSDLTSDNGTYMTFGSYPSLTETPIQNMNFTSDLSNWTYDTGISWENFGSPLSGAGSARGQTAVGRNKLLKGSCEQDFDIAAIPNSALLTFYWKKNYTSAVVTHTIEVKLLVGATTKYTWSNTTIGTIDWTWESIDVTPYMDETGTWTLELYWDLKNANDPNAQVWANFDDVGIKLVGEHTAEVEFIGSSNTENWTQLNWTVDCGWTAASVNVTLQLYDYTLDSYPTGGNGYIAYASDSTPDTDETRNQTITVNPTHFRNATGYWKIKIKGVKVTDTRFSLKADWIEFKPTSTSGSGTIFTFKNEGPLTAQLVSLWIVNSTHHQRYDINLIINAGQTLTYTRDDISLASGEYLVKAVTRRGNTAAYAGS